MNKPGVYVRKCPRGCHDEVFVLTREGKILHVSLPITAGDATIDGGPLNDGIDLRAELAREGSPVNYTSFIDEDTDDAPDTNH